MQVREFILPKIINKNLLYIIIKQNLIYIYVSKDNVPVNFEAIGTIAGLQNRS